MIESPFMLTQREKEKQARKARAVDRLAAFAFGMSAGLGVAFIIFTLAR